VGQGQQAVNDVFTAQQQDTRSFKLNLYLARALFAAGRLGDALGSANRSKDMAETDAELSQVYYWRAQILEANGNLPGARRDWQALLALDKKAVPEEWRALAEARLKASATPPPKASPTPSATRTGAATTTPTLTSTLTPTRTPSPTPAR